MKATFPFISFHHPKTCTAPLALKCSSQTQSHLQFTPFYLAGSLRLSIDVLPTQPLNMILSAHWVPSQHTEQKVQLCSLKLTRFFFFCWRYWINRVYVGIAWPDWKLPLSSDWQDWRLLFLSSLLVSLCNYHSAYLFKFNVTIPNTVPLPTLEPTESETSHWDTSIHPPIHPFPEYSPHQRHCQPKAYWDLELVLGCSISKGF